MTFQVSFVILILFSTYFCVQVHATDYYFSNFCKSGIGNLTINTTSSGVGSRGSIRESYPPSSYANGLNCTLLLKPPSGYGITLSFEEIHLRMTEYLTCLDTISIQSSSYASWHNKLSNTCNEYFPREYSNSGPMRINFKTGNSSDPSSTIGSTFHITYSTYYLGDNTGAIAGGIVAAIVVVIIVVAIVFICLRRGSTTTVRAPLVTTMVYPQQTYANPQPPPYSYSQQHVPQQTNYYTQSQPPPYGYNQQHVPQQTNYYTQSQP